MVDWSKYDATAREEADTKAANLDRLREITLSHLQRLRQAGIQPDSWGLWPIGTFGNGYTYSADARGDWYVFVPVTRYLDRDAWQTPMPSGPSYQGVEKTLVEPPLLDEEALALALAKHYHIVTGGGSQ